MAYIIVEKWDKANENRTFELGQEITCIGCASTNNSPDIPINDPHVSRKHIEIRYDHDHYVLQDVGSRNGTQMDGKLLKTGKSYRLRDNCVIALAIASGTPRVVLRFCDGEQSTIPDGPFKRRDGWLTIDEDRQEVYVDGNKVQLSRNLYRLILCLYLNQDKPCSKETIISYVYAENRDTKFCTDEQIETLIHRLKKCVEHDPSNPRRIITRKGYEYIFVGPTTAR
jgi:FHA domain/Transcriptional regulatory protein, C terminal